MNFSHGSYEYHQSVIDNTRNMVTGLYLHTFSIRSVLTLMVFLANPGGRPIAIALDTVRLILNRLLHH